MSLSLLPILNSWQISSEDSEQRLILTGFNWEKYQQLLLTFSDISGYRTTYLAGILEIMSPSRLHEIRKRNMARLLEVYLERAGIDFWGLGSMTLRNESAQVGKEPDECYCLETEKDLPDLAIEVIITSGSIKILEVYLSLGVKEVWLWQDDELGVYCLENNQYLLCPSSRLLPKLDLPLLAQLITHPNPRLAMQQFRENLI